MNLFAHRDHEEKVEAMRIFSDHVLPGRWDDARLPNPSEIKGTKVILPNPPPKVIVLTTSFVLNLRWSR